MSPRYLQPKKLAEVLAQLQRTWADLNRHHRRLQTAKDLRRRSIEAAFLQLQLVEIEQLLDDLKQHLPKEGEGWDWTDLLSPEVRKKVRQVERDYDSEAEARKRWLQYNQLIPKL